MRTTLEIDDDLVATAKQLAKKQGTTLGRVISDLARKSLPVEAPRTMRNGVWVFTPSPNPAFKPDLEYINSLRDEE